MYPFGSMKCHYHTYVFKNFVKSLNRKAFIIKYNFIKEYYKTIC